jgi:hypothetical protein
MPGALQQEDMIQCKVKQSFIPQHYVDRCKMSLDQAFQPFPYPYVGHASRVHNRTMVEYLQKSECGGLGLLLPYSTTIGRRFERGILLLLKSDYMYSKSTTRLHCGFGRYFSARNILLSMTVQALS